MAEAKLCSIPDCGKPRICRGFCKYHYAKQRKAGLLCDDGSAKTCFVAECGRPAITRGYCDKHYQRFKKFGSPDVCNKRVEPNHCGKQWCPGARAIWHHMQEVRDPEGLKKTKRAYVKAYRERHAERVKELGRQYLSRPEVREARRQKSKEYAKANPAKAVWYARQRRLRLAQAAPPWLTDGDWKAMDALYDEAKRLSAETGIEHHVDHIVPLKAVPNVCGLHVVWNLRVIPGVENVRRPRTLEIA